MSRARRTFASERIGGAALAVVLVTVLVGCSATAATHSTGPAATPTNRQPAASTPMPSPTPAPTPTGRPGTFTSTDLASPATAAWKTAVLLKNGEVLIVGNGAAALYDPITGHIQNTGTPIPPPEDTEDPPAQVTFEANLSVTLDNGQVLNLGGFDAQLYNPSTGQFSLAGTEPAADMADVAVRLHDGRVLGIGGSPGTWIAANCDIYDPTTGRFSVSGPLNVARQNFTSTVLVDGRVLVAGGDADGQSSTDVFSSAELYDPASGRWSRTGSMTTPRTQASATLLDSGKVLIAGGDDAAGNYLASAELYDPATGRFSKTGNLVAGRDSQAAVLLRDGHVLVAGGRGEIDDMDETLTSAEIYNPSTGEFTRTGSMPDEITVGPSLFLPDGRVLVFGSGSEAELYWPY